MLNRIQPKKNFNLDTSDIDGAQARNKKYLDRGKKKQDFFKVESPSINEYYNKMNSQGNSVVGGIIKEQFKYVPEDRSKRDTSLEPF